MTQHRPRRALALAALLAAPLVVAALNGCRAEDPASVAPTPVAEVAAPAAAANRTGTWLGGPEPLSGKLPSGIVSWWQFQPAQPRAGEAFELKLRLEGVKQDGARVSLRGGDGAILQGAASAGWRLTKDRPAELSVRVVAPAGDSFVHVETRQGDRVSTRTILLALPGSNPQAAGQQRQDYAKDASGEPIVRMQTSGK